MYFSVCATCTAPILSTLLIFNNNSIPHDQIRTVLADETSLVQHGDTNLAATGDFGFGELKAQRFLVRRLT
jgi:hypothetical protein